VTHFEVVKRRRYFIALIVAAGTCAAAVSADLLFQPQHVRLVGLNVSSGLSGVTYLSATVMFATALGWLRTVPRATRRITVQELRLLGQQQPGRQAK